LAVISPFLKQKRPRLVYAWSLLSYIKHQGFAMD